MDLLLDLDLIFKVLKHYTQSSGIKILSKM